MDWITLALRTLLPEYLRVAGSGQHGDGRVDGLVLAQRVDDFALLMIIAAHDFSCQIGRDVAAVDVEVAVEVVLEHPGQHVKLG